MSSPSEASPPVCTERLRARRLRPQNVVVRLVARETWGARRAGAHFQAARELYQNVYPNVTVVNVEKPPCFLRKFSPCGRRFVAFSADQTSLEVYRYRGAQAAGDLVAGYPHELVQQQQGDESSSDGGGGGGAQQRRIRACAFDRFFELRHVVDVCRSAAAAAAGGEQPRLGRFDQLNRECSLFTDDGRYVIVGSAAQIADDARPQFHQIHTNNEAVTPTTRSALEDYSLHLVDLVEGKLRDTRRFDVDKIYLSHNQGIYLYRDALAVLSVQHQTIHTFRIVDGALVEQRRIGRFCHEDDEYLLGASGETRPFLERTINSLKHRLLAFLFRRAKAAGGPLALRNFYKHFDTFGALRMWKMQLLDEDHLLIKYASEDVVTLRVAEPNGQSSFFVVYNISRAEVLEVYENTSERLLRLFEDFCDSFRNARLHAESQFTCSPSNNLHARLAQQRFKQTIVRAIYGGRTEATKRILAQLPISAQSYSSSPYLDLGLFSYDDKWVSVMERPKAYGEYPIRFYARDSGLLKFRIYAGVMGQAAPATARRLVAFTFHPTDPFAISVQRTNSEYIVNFHIRNVVFDESS